MNSNSSVESLFLHLILFRDRFISHPSKHKQPQAIVKGRKSPSARLQQGRVQSAGNQSSQTGGSVFGAGSALTARDIS